MRALFFILIILGTVVVKAQTSVSIKDKQISLSRGGKTLVTIDSITLNFISPESQEILFRGTDSLSIRLFFPKMFDFSRIEQGFDHELILGISFHDNYFHITGRGDWIRSFTIHLKDNQEHFFGLQEMLYPDNKKSPDLRGNMIEVEVDGQQYQYAENFASAWSAFYYTNKGYASFMNTFARGRYYLGMNHQTKIWHETNTIDWYVFTGSDQDIYSQYYKVIGQPKQVPYWSCGPIIWRDENKNGSDEVLDDARKFNSLKIPVTALMIDRPYSNGAQRWSQMDFDSSFTNPGRWIKQLKDSFNMELITWVAPATFGDENFPGLLKGSFTYIDLTNPASVSEYAKRLQKRQHAFGVRGHKMDRADEHFPEFEPWHQYTPRAERKNKYVYLYAKITDSILKNSHGDNQLNYARAAYHGTQPYLSGIWGGDPRSTWDGMAGNLANAMRASYMGFPNWGTDVGGYLGQTGRIDDKLYMRWLQWGVFNGIYEIKIDGPGGAGEDRAPWNSSAQVQEAFRRTCSMRMEWMPHIFSQLNTSGKYGPLMKPLAMVFPEDSNTLEIWDQYLFGNTVMVAPVLNDLRERKVFFPAGTWIDYYDHQLIPGAQWKTISVSDTSIPLFIRSGSIRVSGRLENTSRDYLDIYVYPAAGESEMEFVDPWNKQQVSQITTSMKNNHLGIVKPAILYAGSLKIFSETKPKQITVNNRKVSFTYNKPFINISYKSGVKQEIAVKW